MVDPGWCHESNIQDPEFKINNVASAKLKTQGRTEAWQRATSEGDRTARNLRKVLHGPSAIAWGRSKRLRSGVARKSFQLRPGSGVNFGPSHLSCPPFRESV